MAGHKRTGKFPNCWQAYLDNEDHKRAWAIIDRHMKHIPRGKKSALVREGLALVFEKYEKISRPR